MQSGRMALPEHGGCRDGQRVRLGRRQEELA